MTNHAQTGGASYQLSACADTLYLEHDYVERVRRICERELLVDMWTTDNRDVPAIAGSGARFSSMTGYVGGSLHDPHTAPALLRSARRLAERAVELGVPRLVIHPGELIDGKAATPVYRPTGAMWMTALRTLESLAAIGEELGVVYCLENLNTKNHPGIPLGRLADTLALVSTVDRPAVRLMLDVYHLQLTTGNLLEQIETALPWAGEIQVADVPGRLEPGEGEINYRVIAQHLQRWNYAGTVGLESFANTMSSDEAISRFVDIFS